MFENPRKSKILKNINLNKSFKLPNFIQEIKKHN